MFLEEVEDLKDTLPRPVPAAARALPRAAGGRAVLRPARRRPDEPDPGRAAAAGHRRRVVPVRAVRDGLRPAQAAASPRGCAKKAVHAEVFHVESGPPVRRTAGGDRATPRARGDHHPRRPHLDVHAARPTGRPVLDAALQVRADAPFACKGGVCGTCRAKVARGHRRDGHQLGAGARGGRARLRADLPVAPDLGHAWSSTTTRSRAMLEG